MYVRESVHHRAVWQSHFASVRGIVADDTRSRAHGVTLQWAKRITLAIDHQVLFLIRIQRDDGLTRPLIVAGAVASVVSVSLSCCKLNLHLAIGALIATQRPIGSDK